MSDIHTDEESLCYLDVDRIDYDPAIPRPALDAEDLFCYAHLELRTPADIPPLRVRFDSESGKYFILSTGPAYSNEGLPLEAARLVGLSNLPCRIGGNGQLPSAVRQSPLPFSPSGTCPLTPDPVRLDQLFRDLHHALACIAARVRRRTSATALRVADDADWVQEALLALWRELKERDLPRLTGASDLRRYVGAILCNQAAKAMKLGGRARALHEGCTSSARTVPEEMIAAEERRRWDEAVDGLQALIAQAGEALRDAISRMPRREAAAAEAWLDGAGLRRAGAAVGLTLAQVRRVIRRLRRGLPGVLVRQACQDLEMIYRVCPSAAGRVKLGRLARLLHRRVRTP